MIYTIGKSIGYTPNYISKSGERFEVIARLEWRAEPPNEPGHYRAINKLGHGIWVDVRKIKDRMFVDYGGGDTAELSDFTCWLGPLPEPEPPKE